MAMFLVEFVDVGTAGRTEEMVWSESIGEALYLFWRAHPEGGIALVSIKEVEGEDSEATEQG